MTSERITLADLSETYDDPDEEGSSARLAVKKEFVDVATYEPEGFGKLFGHQRNLVQLLSSKSHRKEMAVIWPTGRGKSKLIAELIRRIVDHPQKFGNRTNSQKFIIIVKLSIIEQWKAELEKYPEFTTKKLRDDGATYIIAVKQKELSAAINKIVSLKKQDMFAKELADMTNNEIKEKYNSEVSC